MLLFRFSCAPDDSLDKLRREIEEARRQNEALEAANRLAYARIDSLQREGRRKQKLVDSLAVVMKNREKTIIKTESSA